MKKIYLTLLFIILAALLLNYYKPVGTVEGPEWDILRIDGVTYISRGSASVDIPYSRADKGKHLGIIRSGDHIFHIYEIKGDPERNYLYWAWEWEGKMFVRKELSDAAKTAQIPVTEFSYVETVKNYKPDDPGVKTDGFKNDSSCRYSGLDDLIELAKNECTIDYDSITLAQDSQELIMRVTFSKEGTLGNCQDVFIDDSGKTILIIYGE
ncbi:MAG: hypothetical protein IJF15_03175 [Oscillospiraceae bacterium]|nr:hypothetical protein [Oscillospiraceae bacterium]